MPVPSSRTVSERITKFSIMPISVSIIEDDAGVREGLVAVMNAAPGFRCLSHFADAESALKTILNERPDVVLADINLPGMGGVDCVRHLKARAPELQILILTVYENTEVIFQALSAGASGYLLKQTPLPKLLEAIEEVHQGGSPMTGHIARKVVQSFQKRPPSRETESLSPREQEVLDFLAQGYLYKEIAEKMGLSFETVHTYIRRIYEKLHVRSRTQAVAKYLRS
jgi:DNA-binding NarL/FixJ family response regulator